MGDGVNRIFIATSDPDECDWIKEELGEYGRVVKTIDSLDFFISQWESIDSEVLIFAENLVNDADSFEKLVTKVREEQSHVQIVFLHVRNSDDFVAKLIDLGLICISYQSLDVGVIETRLRSEKGYKPTEEVMRISSEKVIKDEIPEQLISSVDKESTIPEQDDYEVSVEASEQISESDSELKGRKGFAETSEKLLKVLSNKSNELKTFLNKRDKASNVDVNELNFDPVFIKNKSRVKVRDRYIGTAVIAVTGVDRGVGCTHTSILIANYLASQKFSVALVEANESNEYKEIESAYEGVESEYINTSSFYIDGVHYYKNEVSIDMISLLAGNYSYIILDLGAYNSTISFNEFLRANLQIVVGASSDWKQNQIHRFFQSHIHLDQSKWRLCLPLADKDSSKDIKKKMERRKVYPIPYYPDAFQTSSQINAAMEQLLKVNQQHKLSLLRKKMLNMIE